MIPWDKLRGKLHTLRPVPLLGSFALSCALSAGQWGGLYAPWSLALVAARGASPRGFAALLGALLGGWLFFPFQEALRHGATALLLYASALSFAGSRVEKRTWFAPLCAAAALLTVHSVYLIGRVFFHTALCALAAATAGVLAAKLQGVSSRQRTEVVALGLCLSLVNVTLDGFSLGRLGGIWLALYVGAEQSASTAAALGACIGLALDLTAPQPTGALGLLLALSCYGAMSCRSRSIRAVVFCGLSAALSVLLGVENGAAITFESCTAAAAYLLTPRRMRRTAATPLLDDSYAPRAGAFRALYDALFSEEEQAREENPAIIFDRASEKVCRTCPRMSVCYQKNYHATRDAFAHAASPMLRRGQAQRSDFPDWFTTGCERLSLFLNGINDELYAYLLRQSYRRRLRDLRHLAALPYAQMGDAMEEAIPADTQARAALEIACATRPRRGQSTCGDETAAFTVGGNTYLLLSDGMGSGKEAHAEAAMTVRLLRQFLEAGITPDASLQTLNTALRLRGGDGFTTIDLLSFRRSDGAACLHKYGACDSYVCHGDGQVDTVSVSTLPAGLEASDTVPAPARVRLRHGDVVVMVSDGVIAEGSGPLHQLLAGWDGSMERLAEAVLDLCRQSDDDCAVIAARCRKTGVKNV